jgi:hypothetical protein
VPEPVLATAIMLELAVRRLHNRSPLPGQSGRLSGRLLQQRQVQHQERVLHDSLHDRRVIGYVQRRAMRGLHPIVQQHLRRERWLRRHVQVHRREPRVRQRAVPTQALQPMPNGISGVRRVRRQWYDRRPHLFRHHSVERVLHRSLDRFEPLPFGNHGLWQLLHRGMYTRTPGRVPHSVW